MFGTRERFDYFTCQDCGCLQIGAIPADLARHYPSAYYSLAPGAPRPKSWRRRLREAYAYDRSGGPLAALLYWWHPDPERRLLGELGIGRDDAILDVGCGNGARVRDLAEAGFTRALGIDPHLAADIVVAGRTLARRAELTQMDGPWRLIMFHHSLEHLPDQRATLERCRTLLGRDGRVLVRIPTVSGEAFERYGADWVQLDAPRHLYLHSRDSFRRLAGASGFEIVAMRDDSSEFQFTGSERIRRGLPLVGGPELHFGAGARAWWRWRARRLNRLGRGDQFAAVLAPRLDERRAANA